MDLDTEDIMLVTSTFCLIFLILIFVCNIGLVVTTVKRPKFYENFKLMLMLSLATGDTILGFFPLALLTVIVFYGYLPGCHTLVTIIIFRNHLLHFIYGLGLVQLGVEILLRPRLQKVSNKFILSLFYGCIPWITGSLVVIPLCMSKLDYVNCSNISNMSFVYTVSAIVPCSLALLVCMALNIPLVKNKLFTGHLTNTCHNSHVAQTSSDVPEYTVNDPKIVQPKTAKAFTGHGNNLSDIDASDISHVQDTRHLLNERRLDHAQSSLQNTGHKTSMHSGPHLLDLSCTNTPPSSGSNQSTELQLLLVIAVLFFISVTPNAAISLRMQSSSMSTDPLVSEALMWLMVARSFLTPFVMISLSTL